MFSFDEEIKFDEIIKAYSNDEETTTPLWSIDWAEEGHGYHGCTPVSDTNKALKATFQFIKDNPIYVGGVIDPSIILLKIFLLGNQTPEKDDSINYGTYLNGVVTKVYDTFVVLEQTSYNNEKLELVILYSSINRVYHQSIYLKYREYVEYINSQLPPLCREKDNEDLDILISLSTILERNNPNKSSISLIIDGISATPLLPERFSIVRNLIILGKTIAVPVTSITGFTQIGECES